MQRVFNNSKYYEVYLFWESKRLEALGLNQQAYVQKVLDNPEKSTLVKIFLEVGLDKAKEETGDSKKKVMADFFKSKVETGNLQKVLNNSARTMSHHTNWFKSRSTKKMPKAYEAASPYFDEARKLLQINDDDWNHVLKDKPDVNPERKYQTYSFFENQINQRAIPEGTPLTPTV